MIQMNVFKFSLRCLAYGMLFIGLVSFQPDPTPKGRSAKPNILWIIAEDLSPFMGCYGDSINEGHTPVIDRLASEGVLFKRAYATAPVCSPSRSALITGIMQTTTGTHEHRSSRTYDGEIVPEALRIHLPQAVKTIPELMRQAGYFTFNDGKDDYNFHYDRNSLYTVGSKKNYVAGMNGWQGNWPETLSLTTREWNKRKSKDQPWFGQIQVMGGKGHGESVREGEKLKKDALKPPPYFPDIPSQRAAWTDHYNANRGTDADIEVILKELEKDGELENTIIFFFSDHGSNASLRHKQLCYEGGMLVPLIINGRHPAIQNGSVREDLVSLLDVSATTLALAGVSLPAYLDGQNLLDKNTAERKYIVGARDRCDYTIDRIRTVVSKNFRYIRNYFPERPRLQAGYRDNLPIVKDLKEARDKGRLTPYQEQHWFGPKEVEELYDLKKDPLQMNNLASIPRYQQLLEEHRKVLEDWIKKTDDKGQYPESKLQLKATYDLWKDRPIFKNAIVNPEYDEFKK
ncbi:sulfatase [Niabella insulamsoli]|uniref:sulfatase family protein n=1 Tax=Niabella insulamsoli TaxID=3144874 RepID=UPI0031FD3285